MNESNVLVLVEHTQGTLARISVEMLGMARRLADTLVANVVSVNLGEDSIAAGRETIFYGADIAYILPDARLGGYDQRLWLQALIEAMRVAKPAIVLIGHTPAGRDLAPRFAIRVGSTAVTDCVDISIRDGRAVMSRPCYGGQAMAVVTCRTTPQVATIRPKSQALPPRAFRTGEIRTLKVHLGAKTETVLSSAEQPILGPGLDSARVVVGGGRGVGSSEGFQVIAALAETLGGAVAASRPAIDMGWAPQSAQVGLTGKVIAPDVYIAVGISGASQHMAGVATAKTIIAVNKDKDAEIFKMANIGVITDWKPFVLALIDECHGLISTETMEDGLVIETAEPNQPRW